MSKWTIVADEKHPTHEFRHWSVTGANPRLSQVVSDSMPQHYLPKLLDQLKVHGADGVRALLRVKMPSTERGRSGNFAEIVATETLRKVVTDFEFPINRLCWADCPLPMRGDDILGFDFRSPNWRVLKGESKGGKNVTAATIKVARTKLDEYGGKASPHSLSCCAERLREQGRGDDALLVETEQITKGMSPNRVEHALFITSGSISSAAELKTDCGLHNAGTRRRAYLIHLPDYTAAMQATYSLPPII